ncbi:MAG: hypothetical protein QN155_08315 [Armatimonadota bacterium]|nr:hypothetical protein [Armatimonadota bacterium]MDR7403343.1 hypothetical protein [Armatimonadota bacterium]
MDRRFLQTTHGRLGCVTCHGGDPSASDPALAHRGLISRPSDDPLKPCGGCHPDVAATFTRSLHFTARGMETGLRALTGPVRWGPVTPAFRASCRSCHAACGDCHVSRPPYRPQPPTLLGGLLAGHLFVRTPPVEATCAGCHSGRVWPEFTGQYEGFPADVHFSRAKMTCLSCHTGAQLHGQGEATADTRYAVSTRPACTSCHPSAAPGARGLRVHTVHGTRLACQVCHGGIAKSCFGCHPGRGATSRPMLKIGRNVRPELPSAYVLLRHVPTTREMLDRPTGLAGALANFDRIPTWKAATPHTIQRVTARSRTCGSCHNTPSLFLRLQDLDPQDSQANGRVVTGPPLPLPDR